MGENVSKKKNGNKIKFINERLNGWKLNTVNEPKISGKRYKTIARLFKIFSNI